GFRPTHSSTVCGPSPPVSSCTFSMPSSPRSATTSVAPNSRPRSVRSLCRPIRTIRSAPSRLAASTAESPTAPSPITVTVVRGLTPDLTAQWWPVGKTSEGEQRRQECGVLTNWQLHQGALRLGHPHRLALAAVDAVPAHNPPCRQEVCRPSVQKSHV